MQCRIVARLNLEVIYWLQDIIRFTHAKCPLVIHGLFCSEYFKRLLQLSALVNKFLFSYMMLNQVIY